MPGRRTLKRDAPNATTMMQVKRTQSADCQCRRAYGRSGQPISNCKRMKETAGQPRNSPSLPGILQIFFQFVIGALARSLGNSSPGSIQLREDSQSVEPGISLQL